MKFVYSTKYHRKSGGCGAPLDPGVVEGSALPISRPLEPHVLAAAGTVKLAPAAFASAVPSGTLRIVFECTQDCVLGYFQVVPPGLNSELFRCLGLGPRIRQALLSLY
jgi:hypothetical protein